MKLISKETIYSDELVYDIEVEDNHNYCLTNKEIIVHNSGKGFIKSKLLGIDGIVFDVDRLKELVMLSTKLNSMVKDKFGIDSSKLNLKKPEDVSKLHDIVSTMDIPDKRMKAVFKSVVSAEPSRKPNLIFDVTLKDLTKFFNTIRQVQEMGYWKKNISLVWVLNQIDVAMKQNLERDRVVPEEIFLATHKGASYTMMEIIKIGDKLSTVLDGDMYIAFNQAKIDTTVVSTKDGGEYKKDGKTYKIEPKGKPTEDGKIFKSKKDSGFVITDADYIQLKKKEQPIIKYSDLEEELVKKIKRYVPNADVWK